MPVRIGVIAVGGRGMRFGRDDTQKCLISIEGKPILEYALQALAIANLKLIFLLTGFLHEQVNSYLTSNLGLVNDCVVASVFGGVEGEAPALGRLRPFIEEDFIYAGGDVILTPGTITGLIAEAEAKKDCLALMTVSREIHMAPNHPRVEIDDDNTIRSIALCDSKREAMPNGLTGAGLYYFRPAAFEYLAKIKPHRSVSELVRLSQGDHRVVVAHITNNPWFALHTQDDLLGWGTSEMRRKLVNQ